jgi:hypothetical protein
MSAKKKARSKHARDIAKLRKIFRKNRTAILKGVKATSTALESARSSGGRSLITDRERAVLNAMLFMWLHAHDMSVFVEDFAVARLRSRKLVYARVLAVHCASVFKDVPMIIKATIHSDANDAATDKAQQALLAAAKGLSPIRRKYEPMLRYIRKNALAHREHDALKQLEIIDGINVKEMLNLATEMYKWQRELVISFTRVFAHIFEQVPKRGQLLGERIKAAKMH